MPKLRSSSGQTVAVIALFMFALLGMCALAIDVGSWYQVKRNLQNDADAAALAGASQLPSGWTAARTTAQGNFSKNALTGETATYQNTTKLATNDTVTVTVTKHAPSYFAKIFGRDDATITATASATIEAYTRVVSRGNVMPWGIMRNSFVPGSSYTLYTDNSTPNNGALSLPVMNSSNTACSTTSGASDYRDSIAGPANGGLNVCPVSVGQVVDVKTGQNSGPTRQGIDTRITSWASVSSIVSIDQYGTATILQPNSPQLVILPIIEDMSGGTVFPSGSGQVRIVGFAYFVITGYANGGKTVTGTFVALQNNDDQWSTGAWDGHKNTAYTIELTA